MTFVAGDKIRVKELKKTNWLRFMDTKEEYVVQAVEDNNDKSFQFLTLDDGSEASSEWFEKVGE